MDPGAVVAEGKGRWVVACWAGLQDVAAVVVAAMEASMAQEAVVSMVLVASKAVGWTVQPWRRARG